MKHLIKGIGILTATVFLTASVHADGPVLKMQSYTSKILITTNDGGTVIQQIGSPYGLPQKESGDDRLYQGLFGALTSAFEDNTTSIGDLIYTPTDGIHLTYDNALNVLRVALPDTDGPLRLVIMDAAGKAILSTVIQDSSAVIELPRLSPGIYVAGAADSKNLFKSIKFNVK